MRLLIVVFVVLFSGCTSTSFQDFGAKIDGALHKSSSSESTQQPPPTKREETFALTIEAIPSDSIIKIMNIKPKYHDGIQLRSGVYDIWVQREGYISYRKNISVSGRDVEKQVVLQKQQLPQQIAQTERQIAPVLEPEKETQRENPAELAEASVPSPESKQEQAQQSPQKPKKKPVATVQAQDKTQASNTDPSILPAELSIASKLKPVEVDKNQIPVFDGGYLKVLKKGFFSDESQFIEVPSKKIYKAKIFYTASSRTSISWLIKRDYRFFTLDVDNTISIPLELFQGFVAKGRNYENVTLHRAERIVMGYNKQGEKTGKVAKLFSSETPVYTGDDIYSYEQLASLDMNKTKLGEDSYFYMLREPIQKGLYIAWFNGSFRLFNLL